MTRSKWIPFLFLAPAILLTLTFTFYPIIAVGYLSFTEYDILRPPQYIGLTNFQNLVQDEVFWKALRNSLVYVLVTPIIMALSITLAIVLNRGLKGIGAFRALYYVPVITGSVIIGIAWQWLFDGSGGLINGALLALGILDKPVIWLSEPRFVLPIAMLMTIWMGIIRISMGFSIFRIRACIKSSRALLIPEIYLPIQQFLMCMSKGARQKSIMSGPAIN